MSDIHGDMKIYTWLLNIITASVSFWKWNERKNPNKTAKTKKIIIPKGLWELSLMLSQPSEKCGIFSASPNAC